MLKNLSILLFLFIFKTQEKSRLLKAGFQLWQTLLNTNKE